MKTQTKPAPKAPANKPASKPASKPAARPAAKPAQSQTATGDTRQITPEAAKPEEKSRFSLSSFAGNWLGLGGDQPANKATDTKGQTAQPAADTAQPKADEQRAKLGEALGDKTMRRGMKDDPHIEALQKALNEKMGTDLKLDGDYGKNTQKAVEDFQRQNGLKPDGIFGPDTRDKLLGGAANQPDQKKDATASAPANNDELAKALGDKTLRSGMKDNPQVEALQKALNDKMGLDLKTDGDYGRNTRGAVEDFQRQNGLNPDGIFGNDTRDKLLGRESAPKTKETGASGPVADKYAKYAQHRELLARAIAAEARGEPFDTQVGVAQTIMNYADKFGKNLPKLINSPYLSSSRDGNKKFYTMPTSKIAGWDKFYKAAGDALAGKSKVGANRIYFHDDSIRAPRWVNKSSALKLGSMIFYTGK
ncbi:MAG: peptidoglycan-binding protein [Candidatus Eremiobacteraeota bacterium]|nr:peptidoglycan-binding protein [Candidatus Eremiobacteraeota bacterium]